MESGAGSVGKVSSETGQRRPIVSIEAMAACEKPDVSLINRIASSLGFAATPATSSALAPAGGAAPSAPDPNIAKVRILGINDFHGQLVDSTSKVGDVQIGGAATLAAYVARERAGNPDGTVFVSAGDNIGAAPPESTLLRHHSSIAVLDAMGLDLSTFGNHEFDDGYAEAIRIIFGDDALAAAQRAQGIPVTPAKKRKKGASARTDAAAGARHVASARGKEKWPGSPFPWVNANVVHAKTGKPVLPPYVIKTVNGVKVAFIGATTKDLAKVTTAKGIPNIKALDPAKTINSYVPEIQAKGAKAIVVVIHEGGDPSKEDPSKIEGAVVELAEQLDPEVDALVTGHTHGQHATQIAGKQIIHAGNYAKALGVIDLDVDRRTGQVVASSSRLVLNDQHGIEPDAKVAALVDTFAKAVAPRTQKIVGKLAAPLTRVQNAAGETSLGSLIAEAQRVHAKADIGLMNPGGVRQDLDKTGPLKWGEVFSVQPFANRVMRLKLTGAQVLETLEQQFPASGTPKILQVAGMTMHLDMTKPVGQRVVKVVMADGSALDPKKTYAVAANSFIADGGDGFEALKKGRGRVDLGVDVDALVKYLESGAKIPAEPPGRIVLVGGVMPNDTH